MDATPTASRPATLAPTEDPDLVRWAKVIDHTRCIGCHACTTACKSENSVPLSVTRTYVKYADVGRFPTARRAFQVTRCNQCADAPCTHACPTAAMFTRPDGIVDFDKSVCIGCKACIAACPYDAIFINPNDHSAEKCNVCAHRLDVGLEPACVVVCPTQAILVGDLNDPTSAVAHYVNREPVAVRRPEKNTRPTLFYKGAHQATLDPLAAARPDGGLYLWSEQPSGPHTVTAGHPGGPTSSAAALLSYDVAHSAPWDWRVSLYTWTKSLAAGAYLVPVLLGATGLLGWTSPLWTLWAPLLGLAFLALTGALLIWDLEHPERFWMIFARPQWRSWLVRGGFAIGAYGAVLAVHLVLALLGREEALVPLAWVGAPLGVLTAIYTAFLFAQARARDLWQNPLLPPHLLAQAGVAGAGGLAVVGWGVPEGTTLLWTFLVASLIHLGMVLGESWTRPGTAHAELAHHELTRGALAPWYRMSWVLSAAGLLAPWLGPVAVLPGLAGLFAYEHAYVQAGQRVPLA